MKLSNDEFQKLREEWYLRLKETGFKDIETKDGEVDTRPSSNKRYGKIDPTYRHSKEEYFLRMSQAVQNAIFKRKIDRYILTRHCEGAKICDIVKELKSLGESRHRQSIRWIIRKYEMAWDIRIYTRKQLHLKG